MNHKLSFERLITFMLDHTDLFEIRGTAGPYSGIIDAIIKRGNFFQAF